MSIYDITGSKKVNALLNLRWFRHALYWTVTVLFFTFFWGSEMNSYRSVFLNELMSLPPKLLAVYLVLEILVPKLLFRKQVLLFTLATVATMAACGTLLLIDQYYISYPLLQIYTPSKLQINRFDALSSMVDINTVLIIPLVLKIVEHGYRNLQRSEMLEKEKLETELKFLKTQIHPHFFFNTLNNLYSLVLKKSDSAPDVVLMLSELMRYVLYESNTPKVSLSNELKHISNYINLEKLRLPTDSEIRFAVNGNTNAITIEPMLLIPVVENCFKHVSPSSNNTSWIIIEISIAEGYLTLTTENSIEPEKAAAEKGPHGVGMKNVKRRLELLYPGKYELKAISDDYTYLCKLRIDLR